MKPRRVEYDPAVDAVAIDVPGLGPGASARTVRLDHHRALDYDADGRLLSIELLDVSRGVLFDDLPEAGVVRARLGRRSAPICMTLYAGEHGPAVTHAQAMEIMCLIVHLDRGESPALRGGGEKS